MSQIYYTDCNLKATGSKQIHHYIIQYPENHRFHAMQEKVKKTKRVTVCHQTFLCHYTLYQHTLTMRYFSLIVSLIQIWSIDSVSAEWDKYGHNTVKSHAVFRISILYWRNHQQFCNVFHQHVRLRIKEYLFIFVNQIKSLRHPIYEPIDSANQLIFTPSGP